MAEPTFVRPGTDRANFALVIPAACAATDRGLAALKKALHP
ncbi:hypothetical protein [Mycobacterium sp. E1747]